MSLRLFRRTVGGQAAAPERPNSGPAPAGEAAVAGGSKLSTAAAQPEARRVCPERNGPDE